MIVSARAQRRIGMLVAVPTFAIGLSAAAARAQAPGGAGPAAPLLLNHPTVTDTAHLTSGDTAVTLFGIKGSGGEPARGLQAFVTANGDRVSCQQQAGGSYVCTLPTGLDVAATALANGAAETVADAPAGYREQEAAAQAGRLGIWASLPPPPVTVQHPVVQTTAELDADGRVILLDGLIGFPAQFYTLQLQNYIAAHGDRLSCQPQANGRFVCVLPDGTDIARVALRAGIARVSPDANPTYRAEEAKAIQTKSGFWFQTPQQVVSALPPEPPPAPVYVQGDVGDGILYSDGIPTTVFDDGPVFLFFAGPLGFGFFDHAHHWHAAPDAIRAGLERSHPGGTGLRGFTPGEAARSVAFRAPGAYGAENFHGPYTSAAPALAVPGPAASDRARPATLGPRYPVGSHAVVPFRPIQPFVPARPGLPIGLGVRPGIVTGPRLIAPPPFPGRR